jgi:tetratricopeptide (TPR) repeat protein
MIILNNCGVGILANENGSRKLDTEYSKFNTITTKETADKFFQSALNAKSEEEKAENLKNAAAQYYILSDINKSDSYPCIQLGRIYDMQGKDKYAKAYFNRALNLNNKNADANFYLAEFYNSRKQYQKALEHYQNSLLDGRRADAQTYQKIGQIYERFADVKRANFYYNAGLELNPNNKELKRKINKAAVKEYEKSGYYRREIHN